MMQAKKKSALMYAKLLFNLVGTGVPRVLTQGIWRPVYLVEKESPLEILDFQVKQYSLTKSQALLEAVLNLDLDKGLGNGKLIILVNDSLRGWTETPIHPHIPRIDLPFVINKPKLWWPHNMGEPHLYQIKAQIWINDSLYAESEVNTGLREVELVQDGDEDSRSFYFKINGKPVFAKGANYIPGDPILSRATEARKRQTIDAAKAVNMNMIRVWGGGIYESDDFYSYCDSVGMMVWQDFMFACTMYPSDKQFLSNVITEVNDNVKRLRSHPSIVHWCGNNEVNVAWFNWGWQNAYDIHGADSLKMIEGYHKIFQEIIPRQLKTLDPETPYSHTSPLSNWGKLENFNRGSMHYWGVWHGPDDFDGYEKYVGRFVSEYGFQSFPELSTIMTFADRKDLSLDSEVMKHHQKSYIGNGKIKEFAEQYYYPAKSFPDFVYKSQLTQAEGYRKAIRAHRWDRDQCMGTLYWQLNDAWPGPSWSSIDYYGKWKAVHYALKELYADLLIIPKEEEAQLTFGIASDLLEPVDGSLVIYVKNLAGEILNELKKELTVFPESTTQIPLIIQVIEDSPDKNEIYYDIKLLDEQDSVLAETFHFLVPPKEMNLIEPVFEIKIDHRRKVLTIHADTFVKGVYLSGPSAVKFEKNYFDLPAHTNIEVPFSGPLRSVMQIRTLHCNQR